MTFIRKSSLPPNANTACGLLCNNELANMETRRVAHITTHGVFYLVFQLETGDFGTIKFDDASSSNESSESDEFKHLLNIVYGDKEEEKVPSIRPKKVSYSSSFEQNIQSYPSKAYSRAIFYVNELDELKGPKFIGILRLI
jgi:hypothetical protein